ncbi:MAG: hypothetical protein AB1452_03750 [Pseudomonadota bacterium]
MKLPRSVFEAEARYARARRTRSKTYWSISVLEGLTLDALVPAARCRHPALEAAQVHDVPAGYLADPFALQRDGAHFLFFEIYDRARNKGLIGLARSDDGFAWRYERTVLEEPHHLSYPFVFEQDGAAWMLPESCQAGEVRLYEADPFPRRWKRVATLLSGRAYVDPTLLSHEGWHYLFAGESHKGVLHLFCAPRLHGPWREHPASPLVRADARHARPAGRFVSDGTGWIRLAQSTEPVYGAYVSAWRITRLGPDRYQEEPLDAYPILRGSGDGWNAFGMHHLDARRRHDGSWVAVADGLDLRRRWPGRAFP